MMKLVLRLLLSISILALSIGYTNAEATYDFTAKGLGIGNLLEWAADAELEAIMFVVEKSDNGLDFENIGIVNIETSADDQHRYRFFDTEASGKVVFYRLKEIDKEDNFSFSSTIMVKRDVVNHFKVTAMSNTITADKFQVTLETAVEDDLHYALLDIKGEELYAGSIPLDPLEENVISIDLVNYDEGVYKVVMQLEKEKESLIILKTDGVFDRDTNVASKK